MFILHALGPHCAELLNRDTTARCTGCIRDAKEGCRWTGSPGTAWAAVCSDGAMHLPLAMAEVVVVWWWCVTVERRYAP